MKTPDQGAEDTPTVTRRQLLQTGGATALAGLAGCLGSSNRVGSYDVSQDSFDPERVRPNETYPGGDGITMFRRGLRRLGYYPDETVPDAVTVDWRRPVNRIGHNAAKASPLVTPDGETVLIPADTGVMHAVTPDGDEQWTTQTPATEQGFHATPVVVDGVAYLGAYDGANGGQDGAVYAFDTETGEILWRTEIGGSVAVGSSAGYWNGYLYVVAEHRYPEQIGELVVFDAESGNILFRDDRIDGMPHPTVAINPEHERLLTGSNDGLVYCWEFPSLEFQWSFETGAEVKGPIATYDGSALVGSWDQQFYRLGLEDGREEWSFDTDGVVMSAPAVDPENDIVYFGSDDWHIYALDAETGDEQWATNVYGRVMGALSVTANTVLAGTTAAEICALDRESGDRRWFIENEGQTTSAPVPHDGRIYYAERAVVSGYWDENQDVTVETPGHAYSLLPE